MCNCTPAPWLGLDGMLLGVNATAPINALRSDDGDMIKMRGFAIALWMIYMDTGGYLGV